MRVCSIIAALAAAWTAAAAQVPVNREPHHRVVHEEAQLRVLDVNIPPRALTLDHRHEHDIATVSISAADTRSIAPGQPWGPVRPRREPGHAQTTEYTGKPGSHVIENVGATLYRLIAVENLRGSWTTGAPIAAAATTLAVESRAFRVYDVRLRGDSPQTRHTHAAPVVAVLAAGTATADGRRLEMPGQWAVFRAAAAHQISSTDAAHLVEIELR